MGRWKFTSRSKRRKPPTLLVTVLRDGEEFPDRAVVARPGDSYSFTHTVNFDTHCCHMRKSYRVDLRFEEA
jgi:hypothetical protein